jgi:L-histidine N-alpha-methyltransferase
MTPTEKALDNPVAHAVHAGLTATPKSLPAWLFYDEKGSRLFERITLLPEYYLTRAERSIFQQHADSIIATARQNWQIAHPGATAAPTLRLLELGAGTATKTGILLAAATRAQGPTAYLPIDVSASAIDEACDSIAQRSHPRALHRLLHRQLLAR